MLEAHERTALRVGHRQKTMVGGAELRPPGFLRMRYETSGIGNKVCRINRQGSDVGKEKTLTIK